MTCCRTPGAGKLLWTMPTPDQKQHHIHDNFQYEWCPPILITEGLQIPGWHHGAEPPGRRRHRGIGLIHVVQHKLHCLMKSVLFQHWSTSCVKYLQLVKLLWNSKSEHVQKPHFTTNLKRASELTAVSSQPLDLRSRPIWSLALCRTMRQRPSPRSTVFLWYH